MEKAGKKKTEWFSAGTLKKRVSAAARGALLFSASFALSAAPVFGMQLPFSACLTAACGRDELLVSAAGGVLGAMLLTGTERVTALALLAGTVMLRVLLTAVKRLKNETAAMTAAVAAMSVVSRAAVAAAAGITADGIILAVCETVLLGGAVPVFSLALYALRHGTGDYLPDRRLSACLTAAACLLLACAGEMRFGAIRPFRAAALLAVLAAGCLCGGFSGAGAGVCAGLALSAGSTPPGLCLGICAAGLAAGIFGEENRVHGVCAFLTAAAASALADGSVNGAAVLVEAAGASAVFLVLPFGKLKELRNRIAAPEVKRLSAGFLCVPGELRKAAAAIGNAADCIERVSQGIAGITPGQDEVIVQRVRERVCGDCPLYQSCFCPDSGELERAVRLLRGQGEIEKENLKKSFAADCPCADRICAALNDIYRGVCSAGVVSLQNERCRELTCSLFSSVARLLAEIAAETAHREKRFLEEERRLARRLGELGVSVRELEVTEKIPGGMRIALTARLPAGMPPGRLCRFLSAAAGAELTLSAAAETPEGTQLILERETVFTLRLGSAVRAADGALCGDCMKSFTFGGSAFLVISDGMGTGGRAAVDAAMTAELFSRLIRAGLSAEVSLAVANTAVSVRSGEEASATLDVAEVNLFTGETVIRKAGAARSFCTRKGGVRKLEASSMPLGILPEVQFKSIRTELFEGDVLLMMSDGVGNEGGWLETALKNAMPVSSAGRFARELLAESVRRSRGRPDDMTVAAAVLERNPARSLHRGTEK